jgi:hypothetical protein
MILEMFMKAKEKLEEPAVSVEKTVLPSSVCVVCGKPATRTLDGDFTCDEHAELVYEDQVENYTQQHMVHDEWLEKKS